MAEFIDPAIVPKVTLPSGEKFHAWVWEPLVLTE